MVRIVCLCCAAILLGIAALFDRTGSDNSAALGVVLLAGGITGLAYQALLYYRMIIEQRLRTQALAKRTAIRGERRRRSQIQRMQESSERARAAAAEQQRRDKRTHDRQQTIAAELVESERKTVREAEIQAHVQLLKQLSHSELANCTEKMFSGRGWQVTTQDSEARFDLLLVRAGNTGESGLSVARCIPPEKIANLTDLHALEAWREHESADHGYLISVSGFDERVVRHLRLRAMKITLVEAHLMALWTISSNDEGMEY